MGLFENLFKPRPDGTLERIVEAPLKASGLAEKRTEVEGETPPDPATAFLQPKGYTADTAGGGLGGKNQGFVPVLPTAKRAPVPERKPRPAEDSASAANLVVLVVGDVLARIPVAFLRPGPHDLKRELRFHIDDLASDITRGRPAIALSCIAEQAPELFHSPISDADDMAIRLPLQKLVEQVGRIRSHVQPAPPPVVHPPARPPVTGPVEKPRPAVPEPAPVVEKIVEPAPAPPTAPAPIAVAPPASTPPVPEAVAPVDPEPPRAPEPAPTVIPDDAPPLRSPEMAPPGSVIDLSLAAIVPKVPREMVAGPLPYIDESYRISLPFPMIERQLGTGSVEVPAKVFWVALPPLLKHCFIAVEGLTVPLPLEEIFQNLPVASAGEKQRFEPPPPVSTVSPGLATPIVLAPAPHEEGTAELDLDLPPPPVEPAPEPAVAAAPLADEPPVAATVPEPTEPASAAVLPEETALTAAAPAEIEAPSAASAAPDEAQPALVNLQPFRVFHPPSPTVASESDEQSEQPFLLREAPPPPAPGDELHILRPTPETGVSPDGAAPPAGAEVAEEVAAMSPPAVTPLAPEPPEAPASPFSVLPFPAPEPASAPVPAALPPEPEPLVAFTPDQPPPLKIETPAAAVAILRATLSAPEEIPAVAMATGSIQPPRMFRPVVMPPPISGMIPAAPVNLAPTLAGPGSIAGMISLAPAAESSGSAPSSAINIPAGHFEPPQAFVPEPPTERAAPATEAGSPAPPAPAAAEAAPEPRQEPAPTLKSLVRKIFHASPAPSEEPASPSAPQSATIPAPAEPPSTPPPPATLSGPGAPVAVPAAPPPFQLHLPPLPPATPPTPTPAEHTPPALPISRFDQHSLQSLFMTEDTLDLPKISRLAASLPGIQGCVILARGDTFTGGMLPEGFHLNDLRGLAPQVGAAADRLPIGALKNFTLYGEEYSISFFERPAVCLCAIHRSRSFVPGVREKLVAVADELARA